MFGILPAPNAPVDKVISEALAYWDRIRGERPMPSRADFHPMDIPRLLPYVMLIDVLQPLDFQFRLLGTAHDQIISGDYRGRRFSELPHMAPGNPVWQQFETVVADRQPLHGTVSYVGAMEFVPREIEHCLMPLSANGRDVDMILVAAAIPALNPV